jgi:hypothetical protein
VLRAGLATMPNIESTVQKKLGIKWVDTKRLVQQAAENCEIRNASDIPEDRVDEVTTEVYEIFEDLDEDEKASMRLGSPDSTAAAADVASEPDWKRKAREQAERREAEWRAKENAVSNNAAVRDKLRSDGVAEEEVQGTKVISIRTVDDDTKKPDSGTKEEEKPIVRMTTHRCYCVIQ